MPPAGQFSLDAVRAALERARAELRASRSPDGHWTGELSSSALSTATAVTAFAIVQRATSTAANTSAFAAKSFGPAIESGLAWLARHQNPDGGWGDTTKSLSNISTTTLCWAAFGAVSGGDARFAETVARAVAWLTRHAGGVTPDQLAPAIIARYGKDRTFSVPILTHCALAGRLGSGREAWRHVIPLPFELAALPHQLFAALRLPVVSYALPALIAIGQARFHHAPPANPVSRLIRKWTRCRTLLVLTSLQPDNGGFLEATPLTSFVTMSLAGSGHADHIVARRGVEFLLRSQRPDGSWPIDTNLATWVTTLAVNALGPGEFANEPDQGTMRERLRRWLLAQQYRVEHPYTHAAPGAWAWTDLPGGVPDADDTAGALLALRELGPIDHDTRAAAIGGIEWLLALRNRDGGIPTFCRGWGALPFDRSSADITAHALRAWLAWAPDLPVPLQRRVAAATRRALRFLTRAQRSDGSWLPLWFGNQFAPDEGNPLYGTTRVLCALAAGSSQAGIQIPAGAQDASLRWLIRCQNTDGGWGGAPGVKSSVEETALAVEALAFTHAVNPVARGLVPPSSSTAASLRRGVEWLVQRVNDGTSTESAPIGFYFAKLWYYERLYPMIFTTAALRRTVEATDAELLIDPAPRYPAQSGP